MNALVPWLAFNLFVLVFLALDLGVFHRHAHAIGMHEAASWTTIWVTLSLSFNLGLYFWRGPEGALEFFTSYILEKSLSMDNLLVFALVLSFASVPAVYQHKVLFWGVLGALAMRAAFILAGVVLVVHFHWCLYVFGVVLLTAGVQLLRRKRPEFDPEHNWVLRLARKTLPITEHYEGGAFFVRRNRRLMVTPLFLVLLLIETSDVIFAMDSIPAIFSVTRDPFIMYTSNVFAILGMRSLYFMLALALGRFQHLHAALALVLMFVGTKMLMVRWIRIPTGVALLVILGILAAAVLASLRAEKKAARAPLPN